MNYEHEKQMAEEEHDMQRRFDNLRHEMMSAPGLWGTAANDAADYFECRAIAQLIAMNWYDEAEIGRRMKDQLSLAIDIALELEMTRPDGYL